MNNHLRYSLLPIFTVLLVGALYVPSVTRSFGDGTSWSVSDLHINYAAGFVRRGLLGEIAFWLRESIGLSTGVLFPALYIVLTAIETVLLVLLAWPLRCRPALFILATFAPALILFPAYDYGGYLRKEAFIVIGLFGHAILARAVLRGAVTRGRYEKALLFGLGPYLALSTLIHENQAIFMPAHALLIYMASGYPRVVPHILRLQVPVMAPATIAFFAAILRHGDAAAASAICASWTGRAVTACDAIGFLAWGYDQVWVYLVQLVTSPIALGIYGATIVLALVPPVVLRRSMPPDGQVPTLLFLLAVLPSLGLFLLGWDWGRWIHMISAALIALILAGAKRDLESVPRWMWSATAAVIAAVFYVSTWRVNVCCLPTSLEGGLIAAASELFKQE